jgi:hypothetical protein
VYPDPKPEYHLPMHIAESSSSFYLWLVFVFLLDFSIDIIIMYGGLFLLDKMSGSQKVLIFEEFSRGYFIGSVLLISLIGLLSELMLGMWTGGVLIALGTIFLSYYFVSKKLFHLLTKQSIILGIFAIIINGVAWAIIFSL